MTTTSSDQSQSDVARSAIKKVTVRLVPFVAVMFFINYLDRSAIGFAGPNGMESDLGLTAAQYGFASGIFFVGYILLEVPSNMALHRFGARVWLARIMVTWGIVAVMFTWVNSYTQLSWLRFALGVAEAGFFPGAILYLSLWVPARYRARTLGFFYLAQPLTSIIGAPLAGWLMTHDGAFFGLEGWRFMFLMVGLPAVIMGVAAWFYLVDDPKKVTWLTPAEREWLSTELAAEAADKAGAESTQESGHSLAALKAAFGNGRVWALSVIYFGFIYGLYTLAFFLPTIISDFSEQYDTDFGLVQKGLITAVPYVPAAVVLYLMSQHVTKHGLKTIHIALPAFTGAVSVPLALFAGSPTLTIACIAVTACSIFAALPNFWTLPTQFLTGAAAAAGIALINTWGNLAGFAAPWLTGKIRDASDGDLKLAMFVVGAAMLLSCLTMLGLARRGRVSASDRVPVQAGH
ncbi:MFS transporter [Kineosporia sp. J2-2]|uniref:MFS transporter n=1 Tax=Kineosporia corallincola TaxID=2835133 RepID=A0ABS5TI48_9ACTN|nr:MFS transporter [Kineosporia corallincola]MBT0770069.1 MFS transporter [Kineosporia corallincola]